MKTYSSGMYMRLGFAVAIHVDPEVLLIDEVLAVGDEAFTRKCLDKIGEFRRRGKTIVIVTHSLGLVEKMCDEVLWLRQGKVADRGRSQARGGRLPQLRGRAARRRPRSGATRRPARLRGAAPARSPGDDAGPATATARAAGAAARWRSPPCASSTRAAGSATSTCPGRP